MTLPEVDTLLDQLAMQIRSRLSINSAIVGIHTGGAWVAHALNERLGANLPYGTLNISFYRDDFSRIGLHPQIKPSHMPFDVDGRDILLVDDVLYTGRTIRAAMNELFDYGRPASIHLAVLIDRGGRELPISAAYVGHMLNLPAEQHVELKQDELGKLSLHLTGI